MSLKETVLKAQATGNDFVVYVDRDGQYDPTAQEVRDVCDRHFGIGADGVIRLTKPEYVSDLSAADVQALHDAGAQWFMDYRNADGTLAQMCGNGTRVSALLAQSEGLAPELLHGEPFLLGTRAGVKKLTSLGAVDGLGKHVFQVDMGAWQIGDLRAYDVTLINADGHAHGTFVDMGNPHVVSIIEDMYSSLPVLGDLNLSVPPMVTPSITGGQNVEFVRIDDVSEGTDLGEATMRVYERGCGETLSCGTGICASAIVLRARTGVNHWLIRARGGMLRVDVSDERVMLTGNASITAEVRMLTA